MKTILVSVALVLAGFAAKAQNLEITIKGIRSGKGVIPLAVFTNDKDFRANKAIKLIRYSKSKMQNGSMTVYLDLPAGVYGLSVMDDENADSKLEKNMLGIPKEGFGFSNYYHTKMSHPHFDDFKMDVTGQKQKVEIKIRYM